MLYNIATPIFYYLNSYALYILLVGWSRRRSDWRDHRDFFNRREPLHVHKSEGQLRSLLYLPYLFAISTPDYYLKIVPRSRGNVFSLTSVTTFYNAQHGRDSRYSKERKIVDGDVDGGTSDVLNNNKKIKCCHLWRFVGNESKKCKFELVYLKHTSPP